MLKIIIIQIVVTSFALSQGFVFNESMSKNINTIFDEDGSSPDWIEIYNSNLNSIVINSLPAKTSTIFILFFKSVHLL
jgi:hypothetical protein